MVRLSCVLCAAYFCLVCQSNTINDESALHARRAIVFVEAAFRGDDVTFGHFGDIVTDDGYYDERPRWSPHGKSIALISAREGTPRYLKLSGTTARKSIFVFEIDSKTLRKVGTCLKGVLPVPLFSAFDWFSERTIVVPFDNKLYEFDVLTDSCWFLQEFPELAGTSIDNIVFSPDESAAVLSCNASYTRHFETGGHHVMYDGIAIWRPASRVKIIADPLSWVKYEGWTQDSESFFL